MLQEASEKRASAIRSSSRPRGGRRQPDAVGPPGRAGRAPRGAGDHRAGPFTCSNTWKAGHALEAEGSQRLEQWVLQRLGRILEGRARSVAAGMRRSATRRRLTKRQRRAIDQCANYLLKYQVAYLAYDRYLAAGLPIGSGVVEGACRHLVNDRLGITGARWRLRSAEAVLRLRALRSSGDFDAYWTFHERRSGSVPTANVTLTATCRRWNTRTRAAPETPPVAPQLSSAHLRPPPAACVPHLRPSRA